MIVRLLSALVAALALVPGSQATVSLTAVGVRGGDHPAYVRVVVDFADGGLGREVATLLDPEIWKDGGTRLEVRQAGIRTEVAARAVRGVGVSVVQGEGRVVVRLSSARHRFKYVSYRLLHGPERLVVDLWKSRVPGPAATIRDDGCLALDRYTGGPAFSARGRELRWLFEHTVVVRVRAADGRLLAERPLIAARRLWETSFTLSSPTGRRATLEASSSSAKDGALDCLVQVPVWLA